MDRPTRRLGHKKSRNGCTRCKARHVKCDEQRPCRNCVRHGEVCSLDPPLRIASPATTVSTSTATRSTPPIPTPSEQTPLSQHHEGSAPGSYHASSPMPPLGRERPGQHDHRLLNNNPENQSHQLGSAEWLQSLRLMHHYTKSTCHILPKDPLTSDLYITSIPEAACEHEFLMHGLLAISALHYAYVHQDERREYILISAHYQNLAARSFSTRLNDLNQSNCEAYFFLASLIFLLSICSVAHHESLGRSVVPDDVVQSFMLLQGVKGILDFQPIEAWRERGGPLNAMFRDSENFNLDHFPSSGKFHARLDAITHLARSIPSSMEIINARTAFVLAIESLRTTHDRCKHASDNPGHIWGWPLTLPSLFIEMLSGGHPMALVVLAHFAAMVRPYEHQEWVSRGWSKGILSMMDRDIDPEWRAWLEWPRRSILDGIDVDNM